MIAEAPTLRMLSALSPDDAAAYLLMHQTERPESVPEQLVAAWLSLDAANAAAWARATRLEAALEAGADDELLDAMRRHARAQTAKSRLPLTWMAAAAAAVLIVAVLGGVVSRVNFGDGTPTVARAPDTRTYATGGTSSFKTAPGQLATYGLEDGSRLTLDGGSILEVAFDQDHRRLRLVRGRAFFEVASQPSRPFTVRAGDQAVTAVGTQFDVRLLRDEVRVVLVKGRVAVETRTRRDPAVLLVAGQQLTAAPGQAPKVGAADVDEAQAWRHPSVAFRNERLDVVVAAINRGSAEQLVIREPAVARLRVTGVFATGDAARFGRTLAQAYPVRIVRTSPGQLEIRLKK